MLLTEKFLKSGATRMVKNGGAGLGKVEFFMWESIIKKLKQGESVTINPKGNSMTPRIKSGQSVTIHPASLDQIEVNKVVLAKVRGRYYLHLITAINGKKVQISNNHKHVNGWCGKDKIYGIADV